MAVAGVLTGTALTGCGGETPAPAPPPPPASA
ncbi:polysaccharide deacetylase, partial [Streptomyces globisporus]